MKYFYGLVCVTAIFSVYVQFSRKMGNIWIRKDDNNINRLVIKNLYNLMIAPFYLKQFWMPCLLSINYPFIIGVYTIIYYTI